MTIPRQRKIVSACTLVSSIFLAACSASPGNGGIASSPSVSPFSTSITSIRIEVDYAQDAVPYTGGVARIDDIWQVTADNLARVFLESPKTITVPHVLGDMEALTDMGGASFTSEALLAIADKHRSPATRAAEVSYYVLFVNGYYDDGSGPQTDVIGVSLGDTGVIAMFKPVIAGTEGSSDQVAKYVEQATLVHELGHAVGLVNRGIPMTTPHEDTAHPHHCTSPSCAMYWANEGTASAIAFARNAITTGSTVMLGPECLADVDAQSTTP